MQSVMHAGATLEPGVLTSITAASVRTEFSGKVHGAWQLINASSRAALHTMKLFSSIAAFSGSGGQGSYAAGNGVLDSWAQSLQVCVGSAQPPPPFLLLPLPLPATFLV